METQKFGIPAERAGNEPWKEKLQEAQEYRLSEVGETRTVEELAKMLENGADINFLRATKSKKGPEVEVVDETVQ